MTMTETAPSAEVAHTGPASELEIHDGQTTWSPKQVAVLQTLGVEQANQPELDLFFHQCQRTGLDPFARQIYMIRLKGKQTIQTAIDGYRLIARRAADRRGETIGYSETLWADENGQWHELWMDKTKRPVAAKIIVYRNGAPFPGLAMWNEYGSDRAMWRTMPAHMLAKVAEALALRRAFPQDLSGVYTSEEMDQAMEQVQDQAPQQAPQGTQQAHQPREYGIGANVRSQPAQGAGDAKSARVQWEEIAAWLDEMGHREGPAKTAYIQWWIGNRPNPRQIGSVADLTYTEAAELISHLGEASREAPVEDAEEVPAEAPAAA